MRGPEDEGGGIQARAEGVGIDRAIRCPSTAVQIRHSSVAGTLALLSFALAPALVAVTQSAARPRIKLAVSLRSTVPSLPSVARRASWGFGRPRGSHRRSVGRRADLRSR